MGGKHSRPVLGAAGLLVTAVASASAQQVPPPNHAAPVDYLAWLNSGFTRNLKENAAEGYQAAAAALQDADELREALSNHPKKWTEAQRTTLRTWTAANAGALERFSAATALEKCYFIATSRDGSLRGVQFPALGRFRQLAQGATIRARLNLLEGKPEGAVEDTLRVLALARHLEEQPFLHFALLGAGLRGLAYETLLLIPELGPEQVDYTTITARLAREDPELRTWQRALTIEKVTLWDHFQRNLWDADGDGLFEELRDPAPTAAGKPAHIVLDPPRTLEQLLEPVNAWYARADELFAKSDNVAVVALADRLKEDWDTIDGGALSELGMGVIPHATVARFEAVGWRRGTHLVLHLHAYRARTGAWPRALSDFAPREDTALSLDPFSGKAFRYELRDGEPLLYSLSRNGRDDGGKPSDTTAQSQRRTWRSAGDFVFWPPPQ